jgi:REP element-mobilizing transposase RayT
MSHSLSKIYIHGVWGTKYRQNLIIPKIETEVHKIIEDIMNDLRCPPLIINGMPDHIHSLFRLDKKITIADLFQRIKGATSHKISEEIPTSVDFSWQVGYGAFSVSESRLNNVYDYIKNQKEHHKNKSFQEELKELGIAMY